MWIRFEMASLDPDLDPYRQYVFQIRNQDSQNNVLKGKKSGLQFEKSIDYFAARPDGFHLSLEVLKAFFAEKCEVFFRKNILSF